MTLSTYNGYSNPYRSTILVDILQNLEQKKTSKPWEMAKPKWYQERSTMHVVAAILLTTAAALTAGAIASAIVFSGHPLYDPTLVIAIPVSSGVGAITTLIIGIKLLNKSYWQDPAYRQKRREKVIQHFIEHGYNETKARYEHEYQMGNNGFELLDKQEVNYIISRCFTSEHTYEQLQRDKNHNLRQMIKDGIINPLDLRPKLLAECQNINFKGFLTRYSWQPFEDGVVDATCGKPSFKEQFFNETRLCFSFNALYINYGNNRSFWNLFKYGIAEAQNVYNLALNELNSQTSSFNGFIDKYGWELFTYGLFSNQSPLVVSKFITYLINIDATLFFEKAYKQAKEFHLIPDNLSADLANLFKDYTTAQEKYATAVSEAENTYRAIQQNAEQTKKNATKHLEEQAATLAFQIALHPHQPVHNHRDVVIVQPQDTRQAQLDALRQQISSIKFHANQTYETTLRQAEAEKTAKLKTAEEKHEEGLRSVNRSAIDLYEIQGYYR